MPKNKIFPFAMSVELKQRLKLIVMLRGDQSMAEYIRRAIEHQYLEDMKQFPNVRVRVRPDAQVYRTEGTGRNMIFFPIARTIGGERVYVIETIGFLPKSFKGESAVRCDTSVDVGQTGFEGKGVILATSDLLGS